MAFNELQIVLKDKFVEAARKKDFSSPELSSLIDTLKGADSLEIPRRQTVYEAHIFAHFRLRSDPRGFAHKEEIEEVSKICETLQKNPAVKYVYTKDDWSDWW